MSLASVVGSAAPWRVRELERLDQVVRARHPLAVRVGFLGVARGIGTSVAAGLAASILAARGHRVLAVNSSRPGKSLLWHAGLPPTAPSAPEDEEHRATATKFADVAAGIPRTVSGVYGLELADPDPERWQHAAGSIGRFFDYTITDFGTPPRAALDAVARSSTLVCVVTPADRAAIQHALDIAGLIGDLGTAPVVVACDPADTWKPAHAEILNLLPYPGVHVAHDKAHGADRPRSSRRLSRATRLSGLRLAATITHTANPHTDEPPTPTTLPTHEGTAS